MTIDFTVISEDPDANVTVYRHPSFPNHTIQIDNGSESYISTNEEGITLHEGSIYDWEDEAEGIEDPYGFEDFAAWVYLPERAMRLADKLTTNQEPFNQVHVGVSREQYDTYDDDHMLYIEIRREPWANVELVAEIMATIRKFLDNNDYAYHTLELDDQLTTFIRAYWRNY